MSCYFLWVKRKGPWSKNVLLVASCECECECECKYILCGFDYNLPGTISCCGHNKPEAEYHKGTRQPEYLGFSRAVLDAKTSSPSFLQAHGNLLSILRLRCQHLLDHLFKDSVGFSTYITCFAAIYTIS